MGRGLLPGATKGKKDRGQDGPPQKGPGRLLRGNPEMGSQPSWRSRLLANAHQNSLSESSPRLQLHKRAGSRGFPTARPVPCVDFKVLLGL